MNHLIFNGRSTEEFGVWISGSGVWNAPERDVTHIEVPGRNGELSIDNGRFKNITIEYPAFISRGFNEKFDEFRAFMMSTPGYCRLEDTYHPNEFRMAEFLGPIEVEPGTINRSGTFDLAFNCKPQRFLKDGEKYFGYNTTSWRIYNPTQYEAKPLIMVSAAGTLTFSYNGVQAVQITVASITEPIIIDCEIKDVYAAAGGGSINYNSKVTLVPNEFPVLKPGVTVIGRSPSGMGQIGIQPNWYTI